MGEFSPWHLLIVAVVFVVLFGAKRLPDAARSFGRSLRIFKAEVSGLHKDEPAGQLPTAPEAARGEASSTPVDNAAPRPPAAG